MGPGGPTCLRLTRHGTRTSLALVPVNLLGLRFSPERNKKMIEEQKEPKNQKNPKVSAPWPIGMRAWGSGEGLDQRGLRTRMRLIRGDD